MIDNNILNRLFNLLDKSERDLDLIKLLNELKICQPLPRPDKDTGDLLLEEEVEGIYLGFNNFEDLVQYNNSIDFMEGELIFTSISIIDGNLFKKYKLPLGLELEMMFVDIVEKFGEPEWKRSYDNAYRWEVEGLKVLLEFDDENKYLLRVNYQIPQEYHF